MPNPLNTSIAGLRLRASHYPAQGISKKTVLFCLPGGGASAEYFDLAPGYSFANRMATQGYDVITMDHPGTASNTLDPQHPFLTPRQSADLIAACIPAYLEQAAATEHNLIGVGHSMGGMIITLMQGRRSPFSALALFGSSAGGLDWGLDEHEKTYIDREDAFEADIAALTLRKFKVPFPPGMGGPSGKSITFGGETEALTARLRETACALYAAGGMMSMTRGSFKTEVDAIKVPIFFAFGDHDIGIPPAEAPKAYINAASTELLVVENTGHNSFAFSSIHTLCQRFEDWIAAQNL